MGPLSSRQRLVNRLARRLHRPCHCSRERCPAARLLLERRPGEVSGRAQVIQASRTLAATRLFKLLLSAALLI